MAGMGAAGGAGVLTGDNDPYGGLRRKLNREIKNTPLDPYESILYKDWLSTAPQAYETSFADRGLSDSGLATQAIEEGKLGAAAEAFRAQMGSRNQLYSILAGIPYITPSSGSAGRGGGYGGGGVIMQGASTPADRLARDMFDWERRKYENTRRDLSRANNFGIGSGEIGPDGFI